MTMNRYFIASAIIGMASLGSAMAGSDQPRPGAAAPRAVPVPSGQTARYVIPFFMSQTAFGTARAVTAITIFNSSTSSCNASVQFQYTNQTTNLCSISMTLAAGTSQTLCSRPVSDPLTGCNVSCSPALTFNSGHAFVSSSNSPSACNRLAVDPQVYYTNGSDSALLGSSPLTIVKVNTPMTGG